jgi:hypothetical protein
MSNPTHLLNYDNGFFIILEYNGKDPKYNAHSWKCQCRCGNIIVLRTDVIKSKATKSCGCSRLKNLIKNGKSTAKKFQPVHGLSKHPLHRTWSHIIERCYEIPIRHKSYPYYRGKGIQVYPLWIKDFKSFHDWCVNNGWKKGLTIDRINPDGNYEPDNCQFITRAQNTEKMAANRKMYGQFNGNSALTVEKVLEIRKRLQLGVSGYRISIDFNVDRKTIYNIRDRKSWKHI